MTFSLLVLSQHVRAGSQVLNLAALTVFCSILVHGATDTAGAEWIARRSERDEATEGVPYAPGEGSPPPTGT